MMEISLITMGEIMLVILVMDMNDQLQVQMYVERYEVMGFMIQVKNEMMEMKHM